jgi:hypothetical protein
MRIVPWFGVVACLLPSALTSQQRSVDSVLGCYSWSVRSNPPSLADLEHRIVLTNAVLVPEGDLAQYVVQPAPTEKPSSFPDIRWSLSDNLVRVSWQDGVFVAELTFNVTTPARMPGQISVFTDDLSELPLSFNATVVPCGGRG